MPEQLELPEQSVACPHCRVVLPVEPEAFDAYFDAEEIVRSSFRTGRDSWGPEISSRPAEEGTEGGRKQKVRRGRGFQESIHPLSGSAHQLEGRPGEVVVARVRPPPAHGDPHGERPCVATSCTKLK
jgi:hypothetical protein